MSARAGRQDGTLYVPSTKDGAVVATYRLNSPPVFDGMAIAGGRVYLCDTNGELVCYMAE